MFCCSAVPKVDVLLCYHYRYVPYVVVSEIYIYDTRFFFFFIKHYVKRHFGHLKSPARSIISSTNKIWTMCDDSSYEKSRGLITMQTVVGLYIHAWCVCIISNIYFLWKKQTTWDKTALVFLSSHVLVHFKFYIMREKEMGEWTKMTK